MLAKSTNDALLDLYRFISGNTTFSINDVCSEFSRAPITEPLVQNSRVLGKVPLNRHILSEDLEERDIEELLCEV